MLPRLSCSDHQPLLISPFNSTYIRAPKIFRFESAWLLEDNYYQMLQNSWSDSMPIWENLHKIHASITNWRLSTFHQVRYQKKKLMARIGGIQKRIQEGARCHGLILMEHKLQVKLDSILHKEELMWPQRARTQWLRDGDRNTRYYHTKVVTR